MKYFLIIIFICAFSLFGFGQEISLPRDVAEKALKAIELVPKLEAENEQLKKLVSELESAKLTPCVIAINNFSEAMNKLPMPSADNSKIANKEIIRFRKQTHELLKRSVQSQCNWQDSPKWYLDILKLTPIALAVLLK